MCVGLHTKCLSPHCPMEANFLHDDVWTDLTKLIFNLHYCFVNTSKNAHIGFHLHFCPVIPLVHCTGMQSVYVTYNEFYTQWEEATLCLCTALTVFCFTHINL